MEKIIVCIVVVMALLFIIRRIVRNIRYGHSTQCQGNCMRCACREQDQKRGNMKTHGNTHGIVLFLLSGVLAGPAFASGWYVGAEAGTVTHTFKVHYEYLQGGTPDEYTDRASGTMAGLIGGYRFTLAERIFLSLQGRVSADDAEWTLTTDEPAKLSYSLPVAYSASLLPEIRLFDKLSLFGEIGVGQGRIEMSKSSTQASRYDETEWANAYSFGGGLQYRFNATWRLFALYRYTSYEKVSFDSRLPDGTRWESIDGDTTTDFYAVGLSIAP
ncbi:MAG: porin family protein [Spartobacteria bacterium]|nr:porin family protein [Spartobacteria bacterium]